MKEKPTDSKKCGIYTEIKVTLIFFFFCNVISLNFRKNPSSFSMGHVKNASQSGCTALCKHRKKRRIGREDCNFHFECSFLVHGT